MATRRVILIVRDGWGYSTEIKGNAIRNANLPNDDYYMLKYPWTLLKCTGNAVGLPEGTQGGSEPGHLIMGAGRVIWQPFEEINQAIYNNSFYSNSVFINAIKYCIEKQNNLHLMGLLSDQGIHGSISHLYALLELARRNQLDRVYIHCFLDGRDVPERSANIFLDETLKVIKEKGVGKIASIVGRFYAMDRDSNWDRTMKAYNLLTLAEGYHESYPLIAIKNAYERGDQTDYYVQPIVLIENNTPVTKIKDKDSVIFWNFRSDRARQLTYAFTQKDFDGFPRQIKPEINFVCMSVYDRSMDLPAAYPQHEVRMNLAQVLEMNEVKQLRIAETEKYAHVTFFFNSQIEKAMISEDRILVPSPKVSSYEEKPEMSAHEINMKLIPEIKRCYYDFILVNYANCDLVGHSANFVAGIKACEVVDNCVGEVVKTGLSQNYVILLTSDHGNIETMFYPNGEPNPSHGTNPVPFIIIEDNLVKENVKLKEGMGLSNVAPTILKLMGILKPKEMTAESII
jgi:2,3-bisphosphoglycerate-independent phosphoglycerate mutase